MSTVDLSKSCISCHAVGHKLPRYGICDDHGDNKTKRCTHCLEIGHVNIFSMKCNANPFLMQQLPQPMSSTIATSTDTTSNQGDITNARANNDNANECETFEIDNANESSVKEQQHHLPKAAVTNGNSCNQSSTVGNYAKNECVSEKMCDVSKKSVGTDLDEKLRTTHHTLANSDVHFFDAIECGHTWYLCFRQLPKQNYQT